MKRIFAKTQNVTRFVSAMTRLTGGAEDIPRMALVYSEPGYGKTRTALWWIGQNNGVFIRTKKLMDGRWLLEEIVAELGQSPMKRTRDVFRQAVDILLDNPTVMFIDEVDRYGIHSDITETLRDLHDMTNCPIVFIGMGRANRKFAQHPHLYSRFSEIVEFQGMQLEDVRTMASSMCEAAVSDDAVAHIYQQAKDIRRVKVMLYRCESLARINNLKEVTAEHLMKAGVRK